MPKFLSGHSGRKSAEQWERDFAVHMDNAPLCGCGCGVQVKPAYDTLARFIAGGGSRQYPRYYGKHSARKFDGGIVLEDRQERLLVAAVYGDGCLRLSHSQSLSHNLVFRHGPKQKDWLEWKVKELAPVPFNVRVAPNGGYGDIIVSASSPSMPQLDFLADLCLQDGRKVITKAGLDRLCDECVAWIFCDDGSTTGTSGRLHIEGFDPASQELLAEWFCKRYGPANLNEYRGYRYLYITNAAFTRMCRRVRQFIPPVMQYKMGKHRLDV
jgi:hypothetical protein